MTEHLALLESPACVEKAYASGVSSARTLYDLRRLHDEFPEQVDTWVASGAEVTRDTIAAFGKKVRHDELARTAATSATSSSDDVVTINPVAAAPEKVRHDELARHAATESTSTSETFFPGGEATTSHKRGASPPVAKPSPRRLRIKVNHGGRNALIDDDSIVRLRYDDGSVADVWLADAIVLAAVAV